MAKRYKNFGELQSDKKITVVGETERERESEAEGITIQIVKQAMISRDMREGLVENMTISYAKQ